MAGLSSTMNIAKTALIAQQYGLNVTGNNIANVNNTDYSIQNAAHTNNITLSYAGHLFGTGVNVADVEQAVDQLLENRLTDEKSALAAFEEAESYMRVLEGIFDENSDSSLTNILGDYWDAWHDLADNPLGTAERVLIYETGNQLADRFNTIGNDLDELLIELTSEIQAAIVDINAYTQQIAELNVEILSSEATGTANDLRDQRNALIDDLGKLINLDVISQDDGSLLINAANGATLVNGANNYELVLEEGAVMWQGSSSYDITADITGGKLSGWLDMRDEIIPEYQAEVNELAHEMIWIMNYQQSQGTGLNYYNDILTGAYAVDDSGWLSSYSFGDKIDYTKDTAVWMEDTSSAEAEFRKILVDMGISEAETSNWSGTAPGAQQDRYQLTVVDAGETGDKVVAEANGDNLAEIWSTTSGGATSALDNILTDQTITIRNTPTGDHEVKIADSGGDAKRSAASIAEALNLIDGVEAYASTNQVEFDLSNIANAEDGDTVIYTLYVDGIEHEQTFIVDSNTGTLTEQFEDSLVDAATAINLLNEDTDLYADGLVLSSDKGATLGIQNFEVQDNAGVQLDTFTNFDNTDTLTFTITTDGVPTTTTEVTVNLSGVADTTDQDKMSEVFYTALSGALDEDTFTVELDEANDAVRIRTLDGSNITLENADGDTGNDATIALSALTGTNTSGTGNTSFEFLAAANDQEIFNSGTDDSDTLGFSVTSLTTTGMAGTTSYVTESTYTGAGATTAAAIMASLTVLMDDGITINSSASSSQGLFGTSGSATTGNSIITLGGEEGFSNFTAGETISFDVDGTNITYTVSTTAGGTTESALANQLYTELGAALAATDYSIVQNGKSVSIVKISSSEDPIEITNFSETGSDDATLVVSTGAGEGTNDPENGLLESGNTYRDFATSSLYDDEATIYWEKLDAEGLYTGEYGLVEVDEEGIVTINENGVDTLSFNVGTGTLVAGNTLTVNMDESGQPDPLDFTISNQANSVNDIYTFKVTSGGTVGHLDSDGESTLTIEWSNSVSSGSFIIEGNDPPHTPDSAVSVSVDGMTLNFYDGSLFEGDVFTITTNESGTPKSTNADGLATGETMSDWHWTLDSFVDQFNRQSGGVTASVNSDNQLEMASSKTYHVMESIVYSGENGFSEENATITINDYSALDFNASNMQFVRTASGTWGILNDGTGGEAQIIPDGGDDNGFQVDLNSDGVADITIKFAKEITGEGTISFDLVSRDSGDINFAFGDDETEASGFLAAAGINTMFNGDDAQTMEVNSVMADTNFIAAGKIDADTGEISQGDNQNAIAFAALQDQTITMKQWEFSRDGTAQSSLTDATVDDYLSSMMGSMGVTSRTITSSREFAEIMVKNMTEQRNSVSAVSLDEEMVNLIKFQQAFSAASKLLTTADEMLSTLLAIR
ncbi:MAG: flagellar hook-associated protein FlgK [Desulfobacter sp.]